MKHHHYTLIFMPWLRVNTQLSFCNVHFVPYASESIPEIFQPYAKDIPKILSSYRNIEGNKIAECVLAFIDSTNPCKNLIDEEVFCVINAIHILTLCALSKNKYFSIGAYSNSSYFQVVFQRFAPGDSAVALNIRCRDGRTLLGGYKCHEVRFSVPMQCSDLTEQVFDPSLLKAFDQAFKQPESFNNRLIQSISLYNQAHTDSDIILPQREVYLFTSAYEQLFANCQGANDLASKAEALLDTYGSIKVEESSRLSKIRLSEDRKKEEKRWFLHRKWLQELYQLRNDFTHGNDTKRRTWGWAVQEHLVMASFVFPLLVKVLLAQGSNYILTDDDIIRLEAIDLLLNEQNWNEKIGLNNMITRWHDIIRKHRRNHFWREAAEHSLALNSKITFV